jgi:hypothetical protein
MRLTEIIKINGNTSGVGLIDETTSAHPEFSAIPSRTIAGINYKTLVRTSLPNTTAGFRASNEGVTATSSTFEQRLVECFGLQADWFMDVLNAMSVEDGAAAAMTLEAAGQLEGQMQALARQVYYGTGTGGNAAGFPGFLQAYDDALSVDAGGTTANTGSSCWLARVGPMDAQWVWGNGGNLQVTPTLADALANPVNQIDPANSAKSFLAYRQSLIARVGLAVHSRQSLVRIKKLTADAGKGLTDKLIAEAMSKFPAGKGPNAIFCNRRSAFQLQSSRPTTIMVGPTARAGGSVENIAPTPDTAFNLPIYVTDAISSTEALTL